jgi:hypothetical protein
MAVTVAAGKPGSRLAAPSFVNNIDSVFKVGPGPALAEAGDGTGPIH